MVKRFSLRRVLVASEPATPVASDETRSTQGLRGSYTTTISANVLSAASIPDPRIPEPASVRLVSVEHVHDTLARGLCPVCQGRLSVELTRNDSGYDTAYGDYRYAPSVSVRIECPRCNQ